MGNKKIADVDFDRYSDGRITQTDVNRPRMKELLDDKGPGFCLAKWTQVTMHLGVGLTHSCHHPSAHKIPVQEVKENPGALHNTKFKKEQRRQMLNGQRPAECDFCWRIEDNTKEFSDRVYKSLDPYSIYDHDLIKEMTGDEDIFPRYVEVSFSNACNFKCAYCGPTFSTKWIEEIKQKGSYNFHGGYAFNAITDVQVKNSEDNPYTEAFWKWFPEAVTHMHTFRITGGEPLMSKHTFRVMEHLLENPHPNLEIAINSNGCPPAKLWLKFTELVNKLISTNSIKKFTLFTSAEGSESAAEYARWGMNWDEFKSNIEYFLENTYNTRVCFMAAFNIFSITTMRDFLEYVLFLKRRYNQNGMFKWLDESGLDTNNSLQYDLDKYRTQRFKNCLERDAESDMANRVGVDIPYVRSPQFLDANITTLQLLNDYLLPAVDFMYKNLCQHDWQGLLGFETWEAQKLKRILVDCIISCKDDRNEDETTRREDIARNRSRFYEFIHQYDERRDQSFYKTFPEMADFIAVCKLEHEKRTGGNNA